MRVLVFWDSIAEWYYDMKMWGWVNMLKTYFWSKWTWIEVANLWISWDEIPDILKRFDVEVKAYTEKYNDDTIIIFTIWINDSVTNKDGTINACSTIEFDKNLNGLIKSAKRYTNKIIFLWLTNVTEELVSPFPWSKTWKCYKNNRIKDFDSIIQKKAKDNNLEYIKLFNELNNDDLHDWIHPNPKWHRKIYKRLKKYLNLG